MAQGPRRVAGELILQLDPQLAAAKLDDWPIRTESALVSLDYSRCLSRSMHIYLFRYDEALAGNVSLAQILQIEGVNWVQYNHYLDSRGSTATIPNDTQFSSQWNFDNTGQNGGTADADVDAVEAWDLSTGGLSSNGDSLVIAIVDDGFDLGHTDLKYWKNRQEIPNNGLDDDNNGYIDDYDGWNGVSSSGTITSAQHGTHVAGIAAAQGNNSIGVSGVNWGLQIMPVIATPGTEADAVEAYGYILDMRRLFDQSNGTQGAYVVATNSSFGINNGDPADFPLWCAMYDSLGRAGILNAVSTANSGVNVDMTGDIPSTCGSEYMIAVTASDRNDQRSGGAAYGPVSIDLAAPGIDIVSTIPSSNFGSQSGTSMASPHVGGAVALMLSYASPDFLLLYEQDPAASSLLIRDLIFAGVDTLANLQGDIATGGRLNLFRSLQLLDSVNAALSSNCLPPSLLGSRGIIDTSATLFWQPLTDSSPYQVRYRAVGSSSWITLAANDTFLLINDLQSCTDYEFQVAPACAPAGSFVFKQQFSTD
ncbi:MAG: S8 family serine peptidase, partial [Bacteroidota bacterium]